ncbi:hypothetical protein J437_LFUL009459 [Ladona fulva]|uniref:A-kinase anchor protein 2 C-terminal domain-containing protein n=1 Tax=Ladona fulva TaxID=123851 RepID=A0A8K0PED3_LADFU|nr:hypothetical protein J437_LFUL009459 [Ladona fulva]
MSAEEKIQEELKQMKVREDELRLQRAHIMAQSQPNLLSIMDESEERSLQIDDDNEKMPSLYSTLSNPNLLDLDGDTPVKENDFSQDQVAQKNARRKSALIAHWESRIQQNTDQ